jgi:hypothetical protein
MTHLGTLRASVALAAALAATGALADLTADEVWEAWQAYSATSGSTTEATLSRDGATLTASGVTLTGAAEDVRVRMTIDRIDFVEQPDGTVAVSMSDAYRMEVTGNDGERVVAGIRHPGLRITVSESETGLNHAIAASEITVALEEIGGPDAPDIGVFRATALGVGGFYDIPRAPGGPFTSHMTLGTLNAEIEVADGDDEVALALSGTGLRVSAGLRGLDAADMLDDGDMAGALAAGFGVEFGVAHDTLRYSFTMTEFGERTHAAGSSLQGDSRFALSQEGMSLSTSSRNTEVTVAGGDLPFPELTLKAAEIAYGLSLPTSGAPEPQDMGLMMRLVDITVPGEVWQMLDPAGQLARTPMTLVLDLAGRVVLPADLFGMETMFGYMMGGPMEAAQPVALDVRELLLRVAGAELTGGGSFTFDPDDLDTFDGLPRPEGSLQLSLQGGNALIDTLVEMGMIPEDQAMAARMVLALFARPGPGPDELVSTIEVREGGAVFANGMRLQ